ncbi:MAG: hypothetical protein GY788_23685 [bacterium]|nr:hypothetical protein [bacterium]
MRDAEHHMAADAESALDIPPIVAIYCAAESDEHQPLLPGDSRSKSAHRNHYRAHLCELLVERLYERGLQGSVRKCASSTFSPHYDELTCDVAVILVDLDALHTTELRRASSFLAWRSKLGLPVIVPLIGSVSPDDLAASSLHLLGAAVLLRDEDNKANRQARERFATAISKQVDQAHQRRAVQVQLDPATMWVTDIAEILTSLPQHQLERLAAYLQVDSLSDTTRQQTEAVLAASLFGATLDDTFKFLRHATEILRDTVAKRALVERAVPLWVDLDAGHLILSATQMPHRSRVCGIGLTRLDLAEHAVKRASANAPGFPAVGLPGVGGEHIVEELLIRHDHTLRNMLNLQADDPPEFIASQLDAVNRAVFALLDCTSLSGDNARRLVSELTSRFPGMTFVLVADEAEVLHRSFNGVATADVIEDEDMARRVKFFVANTLALVGEELER